MNRELAEKIARTVLYEGYMLYPYRPSAIKNQQRWNFGTLYPPAYDEVARGTERSKIHIECLFIGQDDAEITIRARFLQLIPKQTEGWNEAAERSVEVVTTPRDTETVHAFDVDGELVRGLRGSVHFSAQEIARGMAKLTIELANETAHPASTPRDEALARAMISAHVMLYATGGEFVSLLEPPSDVRDAAGECQNLGCFPVLVGEPGERDMLLCSPIILYDYPQIAPESAGDFFDGTEMDEMLTLRVLTLTPEEKQAMRDSDERTRQLLERTEQSAREQLARVHGAIRSLRPVSEP